MFSRLVFASGLAEADFVYVSAFIEISLFFFSFSFFLIRAIHVITVQKNGLQLRLRLDVAVPAMVSFLGPELVLVCPCYSPPLLSVLVPQSLFATFAVAAAQRHI